MQLIKECPICGLTRFTNHLNCIDYTVSHETFQLKKCGNCQFIITDPRPNNQDLDKYYLSDKYISHSKKATSIIDKIYLVVRGYTLKKKVALISKYTKSKTILDFGCGTGDFINTCKSNGWSIKGVEPSETARLKAEILTKEKLHSNIEELSEQKVNVITLWHVLEHIPDLNETFKKIISNLTDNGTIFIAVPNHESYDSKKYNQHWAGFDVPRHLWHFSTKNIEQLLTNHGFKLKEIKPMKFDSYYVSLLSEKYKSKNSLLISGYIKAFYTGFISNIKARKTGNYSSLIYIAQK